MQNRLHAWQGSSPVCAILTARNRLPWAEPRSWAVGEALIQERVGCPRRAITAE